MKKDRRENAPSVPIYMINLRDDHDKCSHMQEQFTKLGLKYTRIDAVNGAKLDASDLAPCYSERDAVETIGRRMTLPEIGTVFSHRAVYRKILDENVDCALVLEDDVEFSPALPTVLRALEHLPEDWDVVLLGHHPERSLFLEAGGSYWKRTQMTQELTCIRFSEFPYGAYGYLVRRSGARKLVRALQQIRQPIDHYTGDETLVNLYGITPACITVDADLLARSNLTEERERLRAMHARKTPSWIALLKRIPGLTVSLRKIQRFVRRCRFKADYVNGMTG